MGISGLHTFLYSHGVNTDFVNGRVKSTIIDGPALAHYLWRQEGCYEGSYRKYVKALKRFMCILQDTAAFEM